VATHGNEVMPVVAAHIVADYLAGQALDGKVRFMVANPPALRANKRFIDSDLNRIYPGRLDGASEERLAALMFPYIAGVGAVIDMHTSPNSDPFVVAVTRSPQHLELAEAMGIGNIALLVMKSEPHSMVQFATCGAGVELGHHDDPLAIARGVAVVTNVMRHLHMLPSEVTPEVDFRYFAMTGVVSRELVSTLPQNTIQDLQPVPNELLGITPPGGLTYPLLCDPHRSFADHYCLALAAVSRNYLAGVEK
jgi:predicted deacylase